MQETRVWKWQYTDESGKRRVTRYHLTEEEARERLRDPVKLEDTLEVRRQAPRTSAFLKGWPHSK